MRKRISLILAFGLIAAVSPVNASVYKGAVPATAANTRPSSECIKGLRELLKARPHLNKGSIFSGIRFPRMSSMSLWWEEARKDLMAQYGELDFVDPRDLHITVVQIGKAWNADRLDLLADHALVPFSETMVMSAYPVQMGRNHQILAVEFPIAESDYAQAVVNARQELIDRGLKPADRFDGRFRAHVTLARAKTKFPTAEELRQIRDAIADLKEYDRDLEKLEIHLSPSTPVKFMLEESSNPRGTHTVITLEEFLDMHINP